MQSAELTSLIRPRELILELSHNCNLSCIMCGFVKERNQPGYFMTEETLNQALVAFSHPPEIVRLNGRGESTIHPKFPEFLKIIREKWPTAALHLFTNLNIRDGERVELLKTFGVQLFVSLDSSDPEELAQIRRGARWEYIERNLKLLADHQPRPYFVFTLQAGNIHRIADMARLARTFNVGLIYNVVRSDVPDHRVLNRVISEWAAIRNAFVEAKALLDSAGLPCLIPDQIQGVELDLHTSAKSNGSRSSCPALHRETCIQHDGFVTPCNMFHPHEMGHIRDGDILQILNSEPAEQFRRTHKQDAYCRNCAWLGGDA
jgi:MoaA/NifB/PqqE/SkfB family radical SAM enzyme